MNNIMRKWNFNLQRHASEGTGAAPVDNSSVVNAAGDGQNASLGQVNGQDAAVENKATLDELLKDPFYKKAYDERVTKAIQGRFKSAEADKQRLAATENLLSLFGTKYGIAPGEDGLYDIAALQKAADEDDSYYETEAIEKNISVEDLKHIKKLERENAEFARREKEATKKAEDQRMYNMIVQGAAEAKESYPTFDIDVEMQNPMFARMVMSAGVPVKTAFEVIHKDQLIPSAMKFAADTTAANVARTIAAGKSRPAENGANAGDAVDSKLDPRSLTSEERRLLIERAKRGEKITL